MTPQILQDGNLARLEGVKEGGCLSMDTYLWGMTPVLTASASVPTSVGLGSPPSVVSLGARLAAVSRVAQGFWSGCERPISGGQAGGVVWPA